jgi:hypothetical protein
VVTDLCCPTVAPGFLAKVPGVIPNHSDIDAAVR